MFQFVFAGVRVKNAREFHSKEESRNNDSTLVVLPTLAKENLNLRILERKRACQLR